MLQLLLLKVWESFLFRHGKNICSILGLYDSSKDFCRRLDQVKPIIRIRLVFLHADRKFDVPKCKYVKKKSSLKCWLCCTCFCGGHKNNSRVLFRSSFNNWKSSRLQKKISIIYQFQNNKKLMLLLTAAHEKHIFLYSNFSNQTDFFEDNATF